MRFNITPAASQDMASIADDLADRVGLDSSDCFLQGVTAKIAWLTQFSSMGRRRDDLAPGIRNLNYEKYLIFYRVSYEAVEILRVVQGSQNLEQLFQPGDLE